MVICWITGRNGVTVVSLIGARGNKKDAAGLGLTGRVFTLDFTVKCGVLFFDLKGMVNSVYEK